MMGAELTYAGKNLPHCPSRFKFERREISVALYRLVIIIITTQSHFSVSIFWKTFIFPKLGGIHFNWEKLTLSQKVKRRVLAICILYDTFVMVLFLSQS